MRPGGQEHVQAGGRVDGRPGRHAHRRRRGVQAEVVAAHQHRQRHDRFEERELVACVRRGRLRDQRRVQEYDYIS